MARRDFDQIIARDTKQQSGRHGDQGAGACRMRFIEGLLPQIEREGYNSEPPNPRIAKYTKHGIMRMLNDIDGDRKKDGPQRIGDRCRNLQKP